MEALSIQNFRFTYPDRESPALDDVNLSLRQEDFAVICGASGSGKTTLLRHIKPTLAPHGQKQGEIFLRGTPLNRLGEYDAAAKIGFVQQSAENQIVTDKVWHELAFGLESLGLDSRTIRLRTAEMASFFGIQDWFHKDVTELSGGQKQLLSLASVMAMQPELLILDEPTGQLDPIAASEFLTALGKINRELGVTVLLTEHRLEEALALCSHAVVMDKGRILCEGTPQKVGHALRRSDHKMFRAMPVPMRIWAGVTNDFDCPISVRDGREWLSQMKFEDEKPHVEDEPPHDGSLVIDMSGVWFRYEKDTPDVLKGLDFRAFSGEITAILGGNGAGKTTALLTMLGLHKPQRGKVTLYEERVAAVPQNPQTLFVGKTVEEDLLEVLSGRRISKEEQRERLYKVTRLCLLTDLLHCHPYDLSGGEQQRAALAKVLLLEPKVLLLDEPTKGLDAHFKQLFAGILRQLVQEGASVIMVSHDIEFCAEYCDACALFFDGDIITKGTAQDFFTGNSFYTTAANRMARHILPQAVTAADVISALGGKPESPPEPPSESPEPPPKPPRDGGSGAGKAEKEARIKPKKKKNLTLLRKIVMSLCVAGFIVTAIFMALRIDGFKDFLSGGSDAVNAANDSAAVYSYVGMMLAFTVEVCAFVFCLSYKRERRPTPPQTPVGSRKLPKRTIAASIMILLLIPLTIFIGVHFWGGRKYYFIGLLIIMEAMLPFALIFEKRKPQAREMVVLSVLTALAVAGRSAFFMLPQFKPVAAMVIITGVAFGGEAGFLVGALTGFISNMIFGHGPWTPWQMFAFGIIGFLAGVLFKKGLLLRSRVPLCVFGGLATLIVYGGLLDGHTALMMLAHPTLSGVLAVYLQGLPFNLIHSFATVIFLAAAAPTMLEKLDRIKLKYGLVEAA